MSDYQRINKLLEKVIIPDSTKVRYPTEISRIRKLSGHTFINLTDSELHELWEYFSDYKYCAGFLIADKKSVQNCIKWCKDELKFVCEEDEEDEDFSNDDNDNDEWGRLSGSKL